MQSYHTKVKDGFTGPNFTSRLYHGVKQMCVCIYPFLSLFSFYTSFFYLILGSFQIKIKTYYYSLLSLLYYLGCNTLHKCSYKKEIELFL